MVRSTGARRRTLRGTVAATLLITIVAGCGEDDFANERRQPAPLTVSAVITPRGVTVSPRRFGAGPIELLASNQTGRSQRLQLRSRSLAAGGHSLAQTTGPINPGGAAKLNADVDAGSYVVSVRASMLDAAQIVVTAKRASAQDRLLQP